MNPPVIKTVIATASLGLTVNLAELQDGINRALVQVHQRPASSYVPPPTPSSSSSRRPHQNDEWAIAEVVKDVAEFTSRRTRDVLAIPMRGANVLLFNSGRFVVTAAAKEENALSAAKKLVKIVEILDKGEKVLPGRRAIPVQEEAEGNPSSSSSNERGTDSSSMTTTLVNPINPGATTSPPPPVAFHEFKIQNFIGVADAGFRVQLEHLAFEHHTRCQYEPEVHPALIYSVPSPAVTVVVFPHGQMVLTGGKFKEHVIEAFERVFPILKAFARSSYPGAPPDVLPSPLPLDYSGEGIGVGSSSFSAAATAREQDAAVEATAAAAVQATQLEIASQEGSSVSQEMESVSS